MAEDKWIKIEDELPPIGKPVLVTRLSGLKEKAHPRLEVRRRCKGSSWLASNCYITAWMPLPEPYTERRRTNEDK